MEQKNSVQCFEEELENLHPYDMRAGGCRELYPDRISSLFGECFQKYRTDEERVEYLRHIASIARAGYQDCSEENLFMDEISKLQADTYRKKNADYGDSFKHSMDEDGILVAKIRIGDKINRIKSLIFKGGVGLVKDERLQDTYLDLANYCVMTILWLKGNKE